LVSDDGEHGADGSGFTFGYSDLSEEPCGCGWHLGVHLVGRHFEERLVRFDAVADPLQPAGDGALGHGFTELGHGDVHDRLLVGISRARRGR
jgi:hypothetical protein